MKYRARLIIPLVVLFMVPILVGTILFVRHRDSNVENVSVIKSRVGKHIILPQDEEPALLTVTDKTKLSSQFLSLAENGDRILIYQNAKRAIIYRPSVDRVVDVGPVSIGSIKE